MGVGCQNLIPRYPVHHQPLGPLDCPDVTLVYHISVSLLYMFFSRSLLTCYLLYHISHSSQVKDTNGLTPCGNEPSCVPGRYPGLYRYCHRRNKPRVAWPHFTRVWAALLVYMMRVWPMYGKNNLGSYHVLQFDDNDAGHLRHYRQRQKLDYMFEVLLEFRERLLEK